jgi:hypothetical protein
MRRVSLVLLLACRTSGIAPTPLPPLVATARPRPAAVHPLRLDPGDAWVWDVQVGGVSIGRVEAAVDAHEVRSHFATTALASAFARVHASATTELDAMRTRAVSARESLDVDGDRADRDDAVAAGHHTVHTALGWLRAWVGADATASTLVVDVLGKPYALDVARPVPERLDDAPALRVDGVVRGAAKPIALTLWFSADALRAPLRAVIAYGELRAVVQLLPS